MNKKNFRISSKETIGSDRNCRVYRDTYNHLLTFMGVEDIDFIQWLQNADKFMYSKFDLSALCLYIGKFIEQEINSSVVQLMRYSEGYDMPKFYCRRNPNAGTWHDAVRTESCTIRLNKQGDKNDPYSLSPIPIGQAYYAWKELSKYNVPIFKRYTWIMSHEFQDTWRDLGHFRNKSAHIGKILDIQDLEKMVELFKIFLKYMDDIKNLKRDLAPKGSENEEIEYSKRELNDSPSTKEVKKKAPKRVWDLLFNSFCELTIFEGKHVYKPSEILSKYKFIPIEITVNGKKGLKSPYGRIIIEPIYDGFVDTKICENGRFVPVIAIKDGKYGLIILNGCYHEATKFEYDEIKRFVTDFCFLFKKQQSPALGILNENGKELLDTLIDEYCECGKNTIIYRSGEFYGLWQYEKGILLPPIYETIELMKSSEPLLFTQKGVQGYVRWNKEFVTEKEYNRLWNSMKEKPEVDKDFVHVEY